MKKHTKTEIIHSLIFLILGVLAVVGILVYNYRLSEKSIRAMYIPISEKEHLMIDQDSGSVFTVTMPDLILDTKGKKITWKDLKRGNIVRIFGDGIMLESYPGQYPGVTKIEVLEEGNPSDANQYQDMIDKLCPPKESSELPSLNVGYTESYGVVSATTLRGGYSWTYADESGMQKNITADSPQITMWSDIPVMNIEKDTDMELYFAIQPIKVSATAYSVELLGIKNPGDGNTVSVEQSDAGDWILKDVKKGMLYRLQGEWENGWVEYGFEVR